MTKDLDVIDKEVQVTVQVHQVAERRKIWKEVMAIEVLLNNVWKGTYNSRVWVPYFTLSKEVNADNYTYFFSHRRELKPAEDITPEERDARTAFCMQLARNIRPRDLEEFFSKVGQVSHLAIFSAFTCLTAFPYLFLQLSLWNNVTFRLLMCELYLIATRDVPKGLLMLSLQIDQLCLWWDFLKHFHKNIKS